MWWSNIVALSFTLFGACASARFTVQLTKQEGTGSYLKGAHHAARARAASLLARNANKSTTLPLTDVGFVQYTLNVGIGDPAVQYVLVADTGSSNCWCGAGRSYVQTSTSIPTGDTVNVTYGMGGFSGLEYLDQVTLATNLVIRNQSIGAANASSNFQGVDGVIGLGRIELTYDTLEPDENELIPTVINNLATQGLIEKQVFSIYFAPATNYTGTPSANTTVTNGAITFGGIDPSLYEGELTCVPVTNTLPASLHWGIDIANVTYGNSVIIPNMTSGVMDSGSSVILLANDSFNAYMNAIPGTSVDPTTGLLDIPASSIPSMQNLTFAIGGREFILDVTAQLVPQDQNSIWGGVEGKYYGVIINMGTISGANLDVILGMPFLVRHYSVYDAEKKHIGLARTNYTFTAPPLYSCGQTNTTILE